jgi:hypothetical protein
MKSHYFLICLTTVALSGPALAGGNILPGSAATVTGSSIYQLSVGTVPESSTWVMMAIGFAGLAFAGYRTSRKAVLTAA